MRAEIKQIQVKPETLDKDGQEVKPKYASINLNVELDNEQQRKELSRLIELLSTEEVDVNIVPLQGRIPLEETDE